MTDAEILELVRDMRRWQRDYFRTRSRTALQHSKSLESKVDKALEDRLSDQGSLV
jgi:hypothetical protein